MAVRAPNTALAALLAESGWSQDRLARAVNRVGAENGTPLRYGRASVNHWLGGTVPQRERVRHFIAEALSRRLRRPVTVAEVGFPSETSPSSTDFRHIVEGLIELSDPSRRGVLGAGLFSAALTIPGWEDLTERMQAVKADPHLRVGPEEVAAVSAMTEHLSGLDGKFGGRYARPMAAAFLSHTVAPYLKADASAETRKSMLSAAAMLCYLTGWMAVDEGNHGLAQQYYVKGLELAAAGADKPTYCHILRGMSVQAAHLGHGVPAVRLANSAAEVSTESSPRMRAFLAGQQAHAYALAGERANALRSIRETERAVDQAESQIGTFGGFTSATLAFMLSEVRHAFGDAKGSVESLQDHFRLRDASDSRRSGIKFTFLLAERQLGMGHLEAACDTWGKALDAYPHVHSGYVDQQVRKVGSLLTPYRANAYARLVHERVKAGIRAA
ncbi:tetratricopeptide repeat protein [Streptomyces sp. NPDC051567]|uniref:tetratricopeptide repeat protein n=1 Tax=Streptomyces sp. NPDC051567 TaxID=3365660 RepID=UPI00378BACF1